MNKEQLEHAESEMINWLSHPAELGKKPAKIECAKEFDYNGLHYYIFKYKKSTLGKWLLGVCGGYDGDDLENCGHVFSEMEEYNENNAEQMAVKMVDSVIEYWKEQAEKAEKAKENAGTFVNFVLLEESVFDKKAFLKTLKDEWQVEDEEPDKELDKEDETVILSYNGGIAAVSLMPAPVPEDEIVYHAGRNFRWSDAIETSKRHKAHLLVSVMGSRMSPTEAGTLLVKLVDSCCKQKGVLGIYANGTVYQPEFYMDFSQFAKEGFPLFNLVWFGLYHGKNGICGYTDGMRSFGYDEIEIVDSKQDPNDIVNFLSDVANYVITSDVILRDGETIGFTAEQKLPITKSRALAVEGESLKIGF